MFNDLRSLLEKYDSEKKLKVIEGADWDIELGAISELVAEKYGYALLFDNIKGYPQGFRVATNLYGTTELFATAVGMPPDTPKMELIKKFRGKEYKPIKPQEVKTGPVMQNVKFNDDINLLDFPVPKYHELDGGRYMGTGHLVIMRDPDTGWINAGVQRAMISDKNTLSLHIAPGKHNRIIMEKYFAKGEACPVVMAFSPDPITYMSSVLQVPWGVSELEYAGWIRNEPLEVIRGELTGIPFPANDEIVIEGEVLPPNIETRLEGPFGEWTGYYGGGVRALPIVRVKAIYYRNNPILIGNPPLKPSIVPFAGIAVPITTAPVIWDNLEGAGVRGVQGVWQLEGGGERFIPVISIKQDHQGHSNQAAYVALGCHGSGYLSRIIIVVDEDIDPTNTNEVLWAISSRCDPQNQMNIVKGCWGGGLDPILSPKQREDQDFAHSVLVIDACKPFNWKEKFAPVSQISPELKNKIINKWESSFKQK